jgi:hypothetical protein
MFAIKSQHQRMLRRSGSLSAENDPAKLQETADETGADRSQCRLIELVATAFSVVTVLSIQSSGS